MSEFTPLAHYDVVVVGGGVVGALISCGLGQAGFQVALLEQHAAPVIPTGECALRVSSINLASARILQALDLWDLLQADRLTPFHAMQVWDSRGRGEIQFDSLSLGESYLGWIIENEHLNGVIWQKISELPNVRCITQAKLLEVQTHEHSVSLHYESKQHHHVISADLLLAADGQRSWVREQYAIHLNKKSYGQSAIIANLRSAKAHQNTARQVFLAQGPLAFLPLADPHQVAIVWSTDPEFAHQLTQCSSDEFVSKVFHASENVLGQFELISKRHAIPLSRQEVSHYIQPRLALLGDAAHTIHPLAGQGLNLGIRDVAILLEVLHTARQKGRDIGSYEVLRRMERRVKPHNLQMAWIMDGFDRGFRSSHWMGLALRNIGMRWINRLSAKHFFMRFACGLAGDLPELARYNAGIEPLVR